MLARCGAASYKSFQCDTYGRASRIRKVTNLGQSESFMDLNLFGME